MLKHPYTVTTALQSSILHLSDTFSFLQNIFMLKHPYTVSNALQSGILYLN